MQSRIVEQTVYVGWLLAGLGWNWFLVALMLEY